MGFVIVFYIILLFTVYKLGYANGVKDERFKDALKRIEQPYRKED